MLSKCLKLVQNQLKGECERERRDSKSKARRYWIVDSTEETIEKIERVNRMNKAKTVSSHDFATLYTNLKHDSLKLQLKWVVEKAFKASGKKQVSVYKDGAAWTDKAKEGTKTVEKEELIEMIDFLIDNMMIEHEGATYKQSIGIPMGTDCAPFLANLYLFALEYR